MSVRYGSMKGIGYAILTALTAGAVAACGQGEVPETGAGPFPSTESGEAAVETVFRSYHQALLARDFATACALNAPETNKKLIERVVAQGAQVRTCEEALAAVYTLPQAGRVADGVGRTVQVQDISVDGDDATISWTFEQAQGPRLPVDTGLRRIDGQWRLLDTS